MHEVERCAEFSRSGVSVVCPVAEIAGEFHYLVSGSGVVVPWSVMGDGRESVEVCAECASHLVGGV